MATTDRSEENAVLQSNPNDGQNGAAPPAGKRKAEQSPPNTESTGDNSGNPSAPEQAAASGRPCSKLVEDVDSGSDEECTGPADKAGDKNQIQAKGKARRQQATCGSMRPRVTDARQQGPLPLTILRSKPKPDQLHPRGRH